MLLLEEEDPLLPNDPEKYEIKGKGGRGRVYFQSLRPDQIAYVMSGPDNEPPAVQ